MRHHSQADSGIYMVIPAVMLPIMIGVLFFILVFFNLARISSIVNRVADVGVEYASQAQVINPATSVGMVTWSAIDNTLSYPKDEIDPNQCRGLTSSSRTTCLLDAQKVGRVQAFSDKNYLQGIDEEYDLPFSLYEVSHSSITGLANGYEPVQALPLVGIEKGCFEPYNETDATISSSSHRYYGDATSSNCNHVKPMYWQSPQKADFDGDHREDLVFFKPNGSGTTWGFPGTNHSDDADFVVYQSGSAYSHSGGILMFNLTTAQAAGAPAPIPVVADFDRDGLSDFGVFEPASGTYRIAYSSSRYQYVSEGTTGISDASGAKGLIAIPGTYTSTTAMDIAIVQTGGAVGTRWSINIVGNLSPSYAQILAKSAPSATVTAYNGASQKPQRGMVAVPAFADYDDDGITEIGYLSYSGGNMTKLWAGKVSTGAEIYNNTEGTTKFEAANTANKDIGVTLMNPFDVQFDSSGNMYYSDAVAGRIWKIKNGQASVVVNTTSSNPTDTRANQEAIFPKENLWNIPDNGVAGATSDVYASAGAVVLKSPRRFVIAKDYDNAMYIADWGNKRIVKIAAGANNEIDSTDTASVVLGSYNCPTGCADLDNTTTLVANTWQQLFKINPSAITVVPAGPSNVSKYHLAFSSKYAVFLWTHTAASGGPVGVNTETIFKIAGDADNMPNPNPNSATATYVSQSASDYVSGPAFDPTNANASRICGVSDLVLVPGPDATWYNMALFAASSCSLAPTYPPPANPTNVVGGILRIRPFNIGSLGVIVKAAITSQLASPYNYSPLALDRDTVPGLTTDYPDRIDAYMGAFRKLPCSNNGATSLCSSPDGGAGIYQRKVDLSSNTPAATSIDMMNPVDLTLSAPDASSHRTSLYFVDQWNSADVSDATAYPLAPNRTDQQHQQGIYRLDCGAADIGCASPTLTVVTNPYLYGSGTIPVESAEWPSPYQQGGMGSPSKYISAHEGPAKNVMFPAQGAMAINGNYLYAASPWLSNPTSYGCTGGTPHPYCTTPARVGFIYRMSMDQDGDGVADASDSDIDGDGGGDANLYCPRDPSNVGCSVANNLGVPRYEFFKADGITSLKLNSSGGASKLRGQYILFNSVSECGRFSDCSANGFNGQIARPEVWATLFNFGDEQDYSARAACTNGASGSVNSAYYGCEQTSNGPIAAAAPLQTFRGDPNTAGYAGDSHFASSVYGGITSQRLALFPVVLSGTRPKENGIKPTRQAPYWVRADGGGIANGGVLCNGSYVERYGGLGDDSAIDSTNAFKLNLNNYLANYQSTRLASGERLDGLTDNDNLNYIGDCSGGTYTADAVVLQNDHDDTSDKESGIATYYPGKEIVGLGSKPENMRRFALMDTDGDGVPNPSWFGTEVFNELAGGRTANDGPYTFVTTGLRSMDSTRLPLVKRYTKIREPVIGYNDLDNLGISAVDWTTWFRPTFLAVHYPDGGGDPEFSDNAGTESPLNGSTLSAFPTSFDPGWTALANPLDPTTFQPGDTLFVGLDQEAKMTKSYNYTTHSAAGAAENTTTNRYNKFGPGLIAARNTLKTALKVVDADIITCANYKAKQTAGTLTAGQACVQYVKADPDGSAGWTDCGADPKNCRYLRVAYRTKFELPGFEKDVSISNVREVYPKALTSN